MQKDKCPDCKGKKEIIFTYPRPNSPDSFNRIPCPTCNGTGEKDSPELIAKIIRILDLLLMTQRASTLIVDTKPFTDQIIALIKPLIEEAKREEMERIKIELSGFVEMLRRAPEMHGDIQSDPLKTQKFLLWWQALGEK